MSEEKTRAVWDTGNEVFSADYGAVSNDGLFGTSRKKLFSVSTEYNTNTSSLYMNAFRLFVYICVCIFSIMIMVTALTSPYICSFLIYQVFVIYLSHCLLIYFFIYLDIFCIGCSAVSLVSAIIIVKKMYYFC